MPVRWAFAFAPACGRGATRATTGAGSGRGGRVGTRQAAPCGSRRSGVASASVCVPAAPARSIPTVPPRVGCLPSRLDSRSRFERAAKRCRAMPCRRLSGGPSCGHEVDPAAPACQFACRPRRRKTAPAGRRQLLPRGDTPPRLLDPSAPAERPENPVPLERLRIPYCVIRRPYRRPHARPRSRGPAPAAGDRRAAARMSTPHTVPAAGPADRVRAARRLPSGGVRMGAARGSSFDAVDPCAGAVIARLAGAAARDADLAVEAARRASTATCRPHRATPSRRSTA